MLSISFTEPTTVSIPENKSIRKTALKADFLSHLREKGMNRDTAQEMINTSPPYL